MALNDNAVFTAARGYIYTAPVDTAPPTLAEITAFDGDTGLLTPWVSLGHTSRDDLPEFGFDGGDFEARGTWQNDVLREVQTEALADFVVINLNQFDDEALSLYYGVDNDPAALEGEFRVSESGTTTSDRALCIVVVDGDNKVAFYAPNAGIRRDDSITMAVDEFAALPLRATFLKQTNAGAVNKQIYSWIGSTFNPTVTP